MDDQNNHTNNKQANNTKDLQHKIKAGFYTAIIFAIIVVIWVYTNPMFNKKSLTNGSAGNIITPDIVGQVQSIGQSFSTMWADMVNGVRNLKK
ncbi:hypothetical protein A3J61_00280 [Candidatus Nomurabacteria bacterium RIFCSPHIGHO2_02_FULL_38_15]|uniref:Uncharacterized protein n=1 Tax=Candidatus Nomurabacteria bacterium RIFCSPHIGHO2_02_FULL_38_15 TaxID=1801752 RepID=A0A1F6VSH4_9BACT|nr:MAG: hypothetical protein A3J61_00280 [Candidatus Nomurabacteria bacterium RIFCSPHIGHO2_02_FULL_38_15]